MTGLTSAAGAPSRSAYLVLATLTAMNLLNYVDRYILAAVIGPVQEGLGFADDDAKAGSLSTAFFLSYEGSPLESGELFNLAIAPAIAHDFMPVLL